MSYANKLGTSILACFTSIGMVGIYKPKYERANEEYKQANNDFYTMVDNEPTNLFSVVEREGRTK